MSQRVVLLDGMGPVADKVLKFVRAVFAPERIEKVAPEAYDGADVLVSGDWRPREEGRRRSEPGGNVLAGCLDRGGAPRTLVYALLGRAELARALRPRSRGVPAVAAWRRVVQAGGRVLVLQVDRWDGRRPFTVADARAALPQVPARQAVLWHDPKTPIRV